MNEELVIPEDHWHHDTAANNWRAYLPYWERGLRASIADEPDPAVRFSKWLEDKAGKGPRNLRRLGVRLTFLEQPYLGWAEAVERIIENTDRETRERIAYEITNPDRD